MAGAWQSNAFQNNCFQVGQPVLLSLTSLSNTRADIALDSEIGLILHSSTDMRTSLGLDTLISLSLRSPTDTVVQVALKVISALECQSLIDTRASLSLDTTITLGIRSISDTRATLRLEIVPQLELRSATDIRASLTLTALATISLRSYSQTRAAIELTISIAPIAVVLAESIVTAYSARMNGKVSDDKSYDCEVRFRWRELLGVWTETEWDDNGGSYYHTDDEFYHDLIALAPETNYEYQTQARGILV